MPSHSSLANRRLLLYLLVAFFFLSLFFISLSRHSASPQSAPFLPTSLTSSPDSRNPPISKPQSSSSDPSTDSSTSESPLAYSQTTPIHHVSVDKATLSGGATMPKLGNETLKAELGRAAWKLFHTTMARFPDAPSEDERTALFSYVHLFARLYPCGECASHFRALLEKFPPQVATRSVAAVWACHVHNEVNKSLNKPEFDCSKIGDFYDCGCAEDEKDKIAEEGKAATDYGTAEKEERETARSSSSHQPGDLRVVREPEQLGG